MRVVVLGNGILGLSVALEIIRSNEKANVSLIGNFERVGCASLAAAAMLNSLCEIDESTFSCKSETAKFNFNREATSYWPEHLKFLQEESKLPIHHGFGTYLIRNNASDELEYQNFCAIKDTLTRLNEEHTAIASEKIPGLKPFPRFTPSEAIFIKNEGWLDPNHLLASIEAILKKSGRVEFINANAKNLNQRNSAITSITLEDNRTIEGDWFHIATGANFNSLLQETDIRPQRIFYGIGCSILIKTSKPVDIDMCIRTPNRGQACGLYIAPRGNNEILIGATNLISPVPEFHPRTINVQGLLEGATNQINNEFYNSQIIKINLGWRPTSSDTLPLIGQSSLQNLTISTGTKRDGLHCSPLIAKKIASIIFKNENTIPSEFLPERKLTRVISREDAIETFVKHSVNAAYQHGFTPSNIRLVEELQKQYRQEATLLHDNNDAVEWGIPPELFNMYKYGHIK